MGLFLDDTRLFYPVYSAYRANSQSQASGWVTTDWDTAEVTTSEVAESSGIITVQEAGYYFAHYNYFHANGDHGEFRMRMHSNGIGDFAYLRNYKGDGGSISGVVYMAVGWYFYCQAYHDNTNHSLSSYQRRNKVAVWRFNGGPDF